MCVYHTIHSTKRSHESLIFGLLCIVPKTPVMVQLVMTSALYARVSTKGTRQDTENQLAQLREFSAKQGWTIVHEYVDRITGKHSDREQFQKLFQDASQRKFDMVLFWSLDRFSRE